jgi:hypothetical protein
MVLLELHVDSAAKQQVTAAALALGARLPKAPAIRPEILPLWLAPAKIRAAAAIPGVRAITVPSPNHRNATTFPAEASAPLKFNELPASLDGEGVTIGILSDSFNVCTTCKTNASVDIAAGNLPGAGNPNGDTTPIVVLQEYPADDDYSYATDEGRAMAQILYSLVPRAKLCFATGEDTQENFAANIADLQDPTMGCGANVIVDDLGYFAEPFFSDGIVTQAVDAVAAKGATYVSAAGNEGGSVIDTTFTPVSDTAARAGTGNTVSFDLTQVPDTLTAGGFFNFGTTSSPSIFLELATEYYSPILIMQWDDPFIASKITADYNVLIFSSEGTYSSASSGIDDNFSTGEPYEFAIMGPNPAYIAITLATTPTGTYSKHVRLIDIEDEVYGSEPFTTPEIYGHQTSANALGIAAFPYNNLTTPEYYTSLGPFTQIFDDSGNRLATPVTRNKPDVAGVDGLDTSFFGQNGPDEDGFPNFYGTSCAAPTVASEAAVVIQAAGGPGKLTAAQVRQEVIATAASTTWNATTGYGLVNAYTGAENILPSTTTALTASPNPDHIGPNLTLTAKVTRTGTVAPTGTATFLYNGIALGSPTVNGSGVATLTVPTYGLPVGSYPLTVKYSGDAANRVSTSPAYTVTLTAAPTTTTLVATPNPVTPPATLTFTATVKRSTAGSLGTPTGSVTFYYSTIALATSNLNSAGQATYAVPTGELAAGSYPITAKYNPDSVDTTSTSTAVTAVVK